MAGTYLDIGMKRLLVVLISIKTTKNEEFWRVLNSENIGSCLKLCFLKPNLHYTRDISPKRVRSDGAHHHGSAPRQHCSEQTSQRRRAVGGAVSDWAGPVSNPKPPAPIAMSLATAPITFNGLSISN